MSGIVTKPYDEELAVELCDRIAQGEGLEEICRDPRFPSERSIRRWMADQPTFRLAYSRAREAQMDKWSDDVIKISDEMTASTIVRTDKEGREIEVVTDPTAVQAAKLRIDTRLRLMSKLAPKTYGDKVDVNVSGSIEVSTLSDEELESRTRARLVALGVEVAGPMLIALPGATQEPAPAVIPEPVEATEATETTAPTSRPAPTGKKSANDLLGLVS